MTKVIFGRSADFIERQEAKSFDGDWERLVTSIVADPKNIDSYGNMISEEEIRTSMLRFMENYQNVGVNHMKDSAGNPIVLSDKLKIVESWQTREDGKIGGKYVPKGAWVMTVRVLDDDIWQGVLDGTYTGFSLEAFATRIPVM